MICVCMHESNSGCDSCTVPLSIFILSYDSLGYKNKTPRRIYGTLTANTFKSFFKGLFLFKVKCTAARWKGNATRYITFFILSDDKSHMHAYTDAPCFSSTTFRLILSDGERFMAERV